MSGYSNHNLSYETVGLSDEGRGKVVHHQPNKGLHPSIVERFLKRRVYFKRLLKELLKDSRESECSRGITMGVQLACATRAKSIPESATIRKEYVKCGKQICQQEHGPYYYAYWKDPESKKLKKKYIGVHMPKNAKVGTTSKLEQCIESAKIKVRSESDVKLLILDSMTCTKWNTLNCKTVQEKQISAHVIADSTDERHCSRIKFIQIPSPTLKPTSCSR